MNGNIFRVGDTVENDNTGLIGKIIRTVRIILSQSLRRI